MLCSPLAALGNASHVWSSGQSQASPRFHVALSYKVLNNVTENEVEGGHRTLGTAKGSWLLV